MKYWLAGGKILGFTKKNENIRGERWKNGEKEIFFLGKNIIFEKGGWGKNTLFRVNIHP